MSDDFGEAIREAREFRGWSQEFLAARVGATQSTIDRIESGATRRSRILPEIAAALDLEIPGVTKAPAPVKNSSNLVRATYVLPADLVERINEYKNDIGIASDDEAVRRLIDDSLKHRDDLFTITSRLLDKLNSLKSLREAAGYVLANHPLVKTIAFDQGSLSFSIDDDYIVEVTPKGLVTIFDGNHNEVRFTGESFPEWLAEINRPRKPYDLDDKIPF